MLLGKKVAEIVGGDFLEREAVTEEGIHLSG